MCTAQEDSSPQGEMYFILTEKSSFGTKNSLQAGTLCCISEEDYLQNVSNETLCPLPLKVTLLEGLNADVQRTVDVNSLQPLRKEQAALLLAVPDVVMRLNYFLQRTTLDNALQARVGQQVLVQLDQKRVPGTIRYIGKIQNCIHLASVYFGVELQGPGEGRGRTDGSYGGTRHFKCDKKCGLFLPFHKLQFVNAGDRQQKKEMKQCKDALPVKPGDKVGFYLCETLHQGTALIISKEGSQWIVEVSPDEGPKDDLVKIPMDAIIKEELLSTVLESDCSLEQSFAIYDEKDARDQDVSSARPSALGVNSMVQIFLNKGSPVSGIIRWIGTLPTSNSLMAGVELDEDKGVTDGSLFGKQYFSCPPQRGIFVKLQCCQPDVRFQSEASTLRPELGLPSCSGLEHSEVLENSPPLRNGLAENVLHGRMKGIQGHCNSCYIDAALFSLFSCTSVLDSMLFKPSQPPDDHIQMILRNEIVNPLRRRGFVSAKSVMKLRHQLTEESQCPSFSTAEKDPEEFLNLIMHHILRIEPLLKLQSRGQKEQECYCYQIFIEKQEELVLPDVQQLLEHSFLSADLKLLEIPSCFIIQMPRFGKEYKMFNKITPSLELDITDLLFDSPRECIICGDLATQECPECFRDKTFAAAGLKQYCDQCSAQTHMHYRRKMHKLQKLKCPVEFQMSTRHRGSSRVPRETMELFAVLCIETSHYVSFVKYGPEKEHWMFFDSMADRHGDENGYNIPTVTLCPEVAKYLESPVAELAVQRPREMDGVAKRLFCDAYMYLYQSRKMALYK
ncbi:ubiquitin carboxyl-terminal hydrolase CYLD [Microcaecilia unicolor]|uniref:Ubiquitin carboxyl-terminal hydrolase CYLD n=1 Tax=Microcaecilia unicolor TaxID=1415580 RepID=A0A6P7ZHS6_9AMPH|nr:ubiquitin carboxyl-terminal hydrolase CYLD-like [Microcaecilia unicolor]XP_030075734.1 ubiquitin carboxyl-terminal hydrolase CYLD-like [Microcaecilia unicolor]XP_030075744.1 ubiquitin carboxyl-terminal hydrolase CYLD-like [Microcaecilia unicolor]XP_030075752.1 ubiquitin carboxyl-terminal hydrolase CYLD-like [Microcaecilia unicolor]